MEMTGREIRKQGLLGRDACLSCRQRMTRAEPGGTLAQNSWRSSKQASARGTSKRMSLEAYSMILTTRAAHAGDWISSLHIHACLQQRTVSSSTG